jgi:hypothetical protein
VRENGDFVITGPVRNDLFLILIDVILDDMIAGMDDVRFAAVIDLQFEHLDIRPVSFHVQEILHQRSSPSVDALEVVTDHGDIPLITGKHLHEFELYPVGILSFIH